METLFKVIQSVTPLVISELNSIRIPTLEQAWGRNFIEEFANEDQTTVEIAKNYSRIVNNCFYRHISAILPEFKEHTTNGSDYVYNGIPLEDKNSFSSGNGWVGNGFKKTGWHILKKFHCDDNGRITGAFIAMVNLEECKSCWSEKTITTNRSIIEFDIADKDALRVIYGDIKLNRKKIKPILKDV